MWSFNLVYPGDLPFYLEMSIMDLGLLVSWRVLCSLWHCKCSTQTLENHSISYKSQSDCTVNGQFVGTLRGHHKLQEGTQAVY